MAAEDLVRRLRARPLTPTLTLTLTRYAVFTLGLVALALTYSLIVNFLSMFESTMCLKFAGGDGCEGEQAAGKGDGAAGQLMASAMSALRALDNATAHANATIHR